MCLFLTLSPSDVSAGSIIANGSFEANTADGSSYNLSNAEYTSLMSNSVGFGARETGGTIGEIDIMTFGGGFGLDPVDGAWHVALSGGGLDPTQAESDALSLSLTAPVLAGTSYALSFQAAANSTFNAGTAAVEIGISDRAGTFGTSVYSSNTLTLDAWASFQHTFVAPQSGAFLTVRVFDPDPQDPLSTWAHVDDFQLSVVPAPGAWAALAFLFAARRRRR